ncbi:hypothetical protein K788_0004387 (plasmid) [Paraburkholderia caribensis MBA4]|uniref:Uncharacterized protein n=1 Tax=Paraburkholderia caribensis MBA4 TaxID=1323664 RepID=A0A0P0RNQ9_9BURK|nr:hypothetical protein K788_0004387 [Paraburkholderia caribensis MBA4]
MQYAQRVQAASMHDAAAMTNLANVCLSRLSGQTYAKRRHAQRPARKG